MARQTSFLQKIDAAKRKSEEKLIDLRNRRLHLEREIKEMVLTSSQLESNGKIA